MSVCNVSFILSIERVFDLLNFRFIIHNPQSMAHVIISDGGAGAWFDGTFVPAPKVEVVDTTAAGDTLLAEFCWRFLAEGLPIAEAGRWAVAAGSAACTMPGGAPPALEVVAQLGQ